MNFGDFYHCAHQMIEHWSSTSCHASAHQLETETEIETDLDVDRGFLTDLRDVRALLDKEKEHKHLVCSQLKVLNINITYYVSSICLTSMNVV